MPRRRTLNAQEQGIAQSVYGNSLPYVDVFISDLAIGNTAVTLAGMGVPRGRFVYQICWPEGFVSTIDRDDKKATLIHELAHVWQGHNGVWPTVYMGQSIVDQLTAGIRDIIDKGEWRGWDEHRSGAYTLNASDFGKDWSHFNVEQQASLVESWYVTERVRRRFFSFGPGVYGGGMSEHDVRFPYIRDVIRARNRKAEYAALALAPGADPQIKAIQDTLVALGYLEARHADGFVGRQRSATLDAVAEFQRRNGLRVDRDLGGPNSETRRALARPISQLQAAQ